MAMPMQWLAGSRLESLAGASARPVQQQQPQQALQSRSCTTSSSSRRCSTAAHGHKHAAAAAAAAPHPPSSSGSSSCCLSGPHVRSAAAVAAAAAGACPLPDPTAAHELTLMTFGGSSSNSSSTSSTSSVSATAAASASAAAAAVSAADALRGPPVGVPGWQISTHIRQSVEEAMKAGMGGMGFVHLPHTQQQQQQPSREDQQYHAAWQQLVQKMEHVEAQHSAAAAAAAAAAATVHEAEVAEVAVAPSSAVQGVRADTTTTASSSSSSVLLPKSTQQIQACRSAAALEQLLQHSWQEMDHVHVSASFVQLARLQQQQQQHGLSQAAWEALEQAALQQLPHLQSRQCANIIWACGSLGVRPAEPLLQGLLARAQALLQQGTTPQGFSNTIWGLASLRVQPSSGWMQGFLAASQQQLGNFQPQELSSTIWALAQLRQQPTGDWHAAFLAASAAKLGACSAQSLCNMLWGVARLGLSVPADWWTAVTYACSVRAAELTPAGVCQVVWAAGMLAGKQQRQRWQLQQPFEQQQGQLQQQVGSAGKGRRKWGYIAQQAAAASAAAESSISTQWLEPLLTAVEPQLQGVYSPALSSLLWALAVLQHNPGPSFVRSCIGSMGSQQGGLAADSAVRALWAVSSLGLDEQQLQPMILQLQQQQQGLHSCHPQELVYLAAALANINKQQQQQQQEVQQAAQQQQQQVLSGLPPLPSGFALPSNDEPSPVDSLAQQLLSASRLQLQQFHPGQLCQLGRWLAAAGVQPDAAWVAAFLAATTPHLHTLQPGQQLLLLHAVTHWGAQQQPGWGAVFLASCTSQAAVSRYPAAHVGELLQALAAAGLQPQQHHLKPLLQRVLQPDAQLDAGAVAALLQGLFSLGFRPPEGWVQQLWAAGSAAVLARSDAGSLTAIAQALQHPAVWQLSLSPNKPFAAAFHAAVAAVLPQLQPQQASAVLAGLTAARMKPQQPLEHLLPGLMAVAVRGLCSMPLQDIVAAWWGLVRPNVLSAVVPLDQLVSPIAPAQPDQQQQGHEWLQQQWQCLWLRRVVSSSAGQLAALKPASLLQLADCLRRLQQPVPASWADTFIAAVSAHIPSLAPHELCQLLHALPSLDAAASLQQFAGTLLAAASAPVLAQLTPAQLSDSLYSMQQAGVRPPETWLKAYITAASAQLPRFWPRQLTRLLTALARLRFMPDAAFLAAATEAAVDHLPRYRVPASEMVDLLWALVALRVRPSAAWMAKFEARLLERGLEQLDGQQLSRFGWCMSALQRRPGRVLWAKWLAATQQHMGAMDGSSLADTLWTCAMLDEQPSTAWLDCLTSNSQQQLQRCSTSSLVTLVWSLALLQHRPHSDWMGACFGALSRCFEATAAAAAVPADTQHHQQQQQQHGVEPLGPAQLTRVAWALAALDSHLPAAFSAQLLQLCLVQAPQLDADSLAQVVWAWDRLDGTPEKQYVRQIAAVARAQLVPQAYDSALGRLLQRSGSSSSSDGVGGADGPAASKAGSGAALQRPPVRIRLGQQRVVLRSGGGAGGFSRAVVVSQHSQQQQQQQQVLVAASAGSRPALQDAGSPGLAAAAHASSLSAAQRALFAKSSRGTLSDKQQLVATLQKIYAAELHHAGSASSSSSSSSGGGSDAERSSLA